MKGRAGIANDDLRFTSVSGLPLVWERRRLRRLAGKMPALPRSGYCMLEIGRSIIAPMNETVYPRSPRETMCGWMHLPRYIDKIRLHLLDRLHPDYQPNFGKGFDGAWLKAAGLTHDQFVEVVKASVTDGQVADWVHKNVVRSDAEKKTHAEGMLNYPKADDAAAQERLKVRKQQAGLADRDDIRNFVDFIDADEKRG